MKNQTCSDQKSNFTQHSIDIYFGGKTAAYDTNYTIRCEVLKDSFQTVHLNFFFIIKFPGKVMRSIYNS